MASAAPDPWAVDRAAITAFFDQHPVPADGHRGSLGVEMFAWGARQKWSLGTQAAGARELDRHLTAATAATGRAREEQR